MLCDPSCACNGAMLADFCPEEPGCNNCTTPVVLLVVRLTPVYLEEDETLQTRIGRDDMINQLPPQYRPRMN